MLQLAEAEAELDAMTKDRDELQAAVDELEEKVIYLVDRIVLHIYHVCGHQALWRRHHFEMIYTYSLYILLSKVSSITKTATVAALLTFLQVFARLSLLPLCVIECRH